MGVICDAMKPKYTFPVRSDNAIYLFDNKAASGAVVVTANVRRLKFIS